MKVTKGFFGTTVELTNADITFLLNGGSVTVKDLEVKGPPAGVNLLDGYLAPSDSGDEVAGPFPFDMDGLSG